MKRRNVLFLIFILTVGFSAVSAVLVINGNINLSFDDSEFTSNVVFTKVNTNDGTAEINNHEQNINFETKKLTTVGDTAVLEFIVGNKSREYDANVTIKCGFKDDFASFNEYLEIVNNITSPFVLSAGASRNGKLTIKLKKAYAENEASPALSCTLVAMPVSRDTRGYTFKNKFNSFYIDPFLNGADPVLDGDKLVPVKLTNNGYVKIVDDNESWYDYKNKEWANAVILVDNPSKIYNVADIIKEEDIESYFVWIPRFRYQIFDKGEYTEPQDKLSESIAKEIQIVFEGKDNKVSNGSEVGEWITHPAFNNYDTAGIWVGKFETGYKGATSTTEAEKNVTDASKIMVKPNVYSWRGITVSNIFKTVLAYEESLTSHMMRNTEWGAVAYLSHSKYGINDEVRINNNPDYLTGYAGNEKDAEQSTTNNSQYNSEIGYLASTTGNITGVYDMNGGAYEYVAGYISGNQGSAGFTAEELVKYANHFDIYDVNSSVNSYNYRILGDATGEMGPFSNEANYVNNWYGDNSNFVDASSPWFDRGGRALLRRSAGQFLFSCGTGGMYESLSFRITLAFNV